MRPIWYVGLGLVGLAVIAAVRTGADRGLTPAGLTPAELERRVVGKTWAEVRQILGPPAADIRGAAWVYPDLVRGPGGKRHAVLQTTRVIGVGVFGPVTAGPTVDSVRYLDDADLWNEYQLTVRR